MKRREHGFRLTLDHFEQAFGRAIGFAAALFPVLQGADADADHAGEGGLGQFNAFAEVTHIGFMTCGPAVRDFFGVFAVLSGYRR